MNNLEISDISSPSHSITKINKSSEHIFDILNKLELMTRRRRIWISHMDSVQIFEINRQLIPSFNNKKTF